MIKKIKDTRISVKVIALIVISALFTLLRTYSTISA